MQIENIARKRLAARRTPQQQAQFAVRDGMLAQVVIDAQRVHSFFIHEIFGNRRARIRCDDTASPRCPTPPPTPPPYAPSPHALRSVRNDFGHRRFLLADRHIDADHPLALLVDDRIQRDGRLAGLAVADDQFALPPADRDHRIDALDARRQRLFHRLAVGDARRRIFHQPAVRQAESEPLRRSARTAHRPPGRSVPDPTGTDSTLPVDRDLRALGDFLV